MLSAIVFVFWPEEDELIEACLKSVSFADEIIIIDNGATPKTLKICKKYTKKIYKTSSKDFSEHHNLGKEKARGDWLLYVDADERASVQLQKEIKKELQNTQMDAYQLFRQNFFLGKKTRYGDRFPDYVTRLFRKDKLLGWQGEIHESSQVEGQIGKLNAPLYHLTHRDIYSMMAKTINFSEHEALIRFRNNHPSVVWWRLVRVFVSEFFYRVFVLQGWRQGTEGWIDGIFQAFSLFIVYVRLWELQRKSSLAEKYKEIDEKVLSGEI